MGGELDSTNIIDVPEAAVIMAMGLDHVKELGPTMADIARAKAGIIKEGGDVVIYGGNPEADPVFEEVCAQRSAKLHKADFSAIVPGPFGLDGQSFSYGAWKDPPGRRLPDAQRRGGAGDGAGASWQGLAHLRCSSRQRPEKYPLARPVRGAAP